MMTVPTQRFERAERRRIQDALHRARIANAITLQECEELCELVESVLVLNVPERSR